MFFIAADRLSFVKLYDSVPEVGLYGSLGTVSIGEVEVEVVKLYVMVVSLVVAAVTHMFMRRTRLGLAVQAVAQDAMAVSLVGVNPVRAKALAMVLGVGLTVLSGGLVALYHATGISPEMSHIYAPLSFAIVVLGTPGHIWGTMVAGVVVGLVISLVYAFTNMLSLGVAAAFIILVLTLVVKPEGLFSREK